MSYQKQGLALNKGHNALFIKHTFIHIQCKDEEGNALAGRRYTLELPDGELIEGELDQDGWAKKDGILPGPCMFTLFHEDEEPSPESHYIDVEVKDEEGRALADEPYELHLPDGSVRKGKLDAEGRVREEDLPPGPCWFALKGRTVTAEEGEVGEDLIHHIRLQFMDEDGEYMAGKPFELAVGSQTFSGTTSEEGRVIADVPHAAGDDGELTIWLDEDRSGESYSWPIRISQVAQQA